LLGRFASVFFSFHLLTGKMETRPCGSERPSDTRWEKGVGPPRAWAPQETRARARIGKTNGIFARCLWERTPGVPPTWTPHRLLAPLFSSSSQYFACILLICAV